MTDLNVLYRRKDFSNLVEIYEEIKNEMLKIERGEGVQQENSYFSEKMQLRSQIDQEYKDLIHVRDAEIDTLKAQLKAMKKLEIEFKKVNRSMMAMQKIANDKDKKIKTLENKILQADQIGQSAKEKK